MGWRTNTALVVLVGGIGGYLYLNQPKDTRPKNGPEEISEKLFPKGIVSAPRIWFQHRSDREPILLGIDEATRQLMILEPVRDLASHATMQSILVAFDGALLLQGYTKEELAKDPSLLEKTGLKEPRGRLEARYSRDEKEVIEFGAPGIRDGEIWVKVRGAIYLADVALYNVLDKQADDFRERLLFTDGAIGATYKVRFERRIDREKRVDVIEQAGRGAFKILEPLVARANQESVGGYLREIGALRIERFVSGGSQPKGLDDRPKDYVLTLAGSKGQESLEVTVLPNGEHFGRLKRRNISFIMGEVGLARMGQWLAVMREKRLLTLSEDAILRIQLVPPRDPEDKGSAAPGCTLVRGAALVMQIAEPIVAERTNAVPTSELLHALTHLVAQGFVEEPDGVDTGLEDGAGFSAVRVWTQRQGGRMAEIRIGKSAGDGRVYAKRSDEEAVVTLTGETAQALRRPWTDFVSLQVPETPAIAFRLEVTRPADKTPLAYVSKDLEWRREGAAESDTRVRDLVDALRRLRAKAIVPAAEIPADAARVELVLRREAHAQSGEVYRCTLLPSTAHPKHALLLVPGQKGVAYRIDLPSFRTLVDRWLAE